MRRVFAERLETSGWMIFGVIVLLLAALTRPAGADDASDGDIESAIRIKSSSTLTTDGGSTLRLPPGYFLPDDRWSMLDAEVRRLQEQSIRLQAENASLKEAAKAAQPPVSGWTVAAGLAVAAVTVGAGYWFTRD